MNNDRQNKKKNKNIKGELFTYLYKIYKIKTNISFIYLYTILIL